jgi:tRNA-dihydrouridine synthase
MGASLIWEPEKAGGILEALVKEIALPISCKIRIRPQLEDSLDFAALMASKGICMLSMHPRTRQEKSMGAAHWIAAKTLKEHAGFSIPLNLSGDCFSV